VNHGIGVTLGAVLLYLIPISLSEIFAV